MPWTRPRGQPGPLASNVGSCSSEAGLGEVREHFVERRDVSVAVSELVRCAEDLVCYGGCGERCRELFACLAGESDVLVHQFDVEPRLVWLVEHEREARLEHRRTDGAL